MEEWVVLIRGINVGGRNRVSMASLRTSLESSGFSNVRTILQSGSIVVGTSANSSEVAHQVLKALQDNFAIKTQALVLSATEFREVVRHNPMTQFAEDDPSRFVTYLFLSSVECPSVEPPERVASAGRAVYLYFPDGISNSKLFRDRHWLAFTKHATARNWSTMIKIQSALEPA